MSPSKGGSKSRLVGRPLRSKPTNGPLDHQRLRGKGQVSGQRCGVAGGAGWKEPGRTGVQAEGRAGPRAQGVTCKGRPRSRRPVSEGREEGGRTQCGWCQLCGAQLVITSSDSHSGGMGTHSGRGRRGDRAEAGQGGQNRGRERFSERGRQAVNEGDPGNPFPLAGPSGTPGDPAPALRLGLAVGGIRPWEAGTAGSKVWAAGSRDGQPPAPVLSGVAAVIQLLIRAGPAPGSCRSPAHSDSHQSLCGNWDARRLRGAGQAPLCGCGRGAGCQRRASEPLGDPHVPATTATILSPWSLVPSFRGRPRGTVRRRGPAVCPSAFALRGS